MNREELIQWAQGNGWKLDRWGHLQKQVRSRRLRLKLGKRSVRYKKRIEPLGEWLRISSGCYGELCITKRGRLSGLSR